MKVLRPKTYKLQSKGIIFIMSNQDRYDSAFLSAFELDNAYKLSDLKYQSIEDWDSIGHMSLMSELEDAFGITIKTRT